MFSRTSLLVLFAAAVAASAHANDVVYDHGTGQLSCASKSTRGACSAADNEIVTVTIDRSSPELLDRKITFTDRHAAVRDRFKGIFFSNGITPTAAAVPAAPGGNAGTAVTKGGLPPTPQSAYDEIAATVRAISDDVHAGRMDRFPTDKERLRQGIAGVSSLAGGVDKVTTFLANTIRIEPEARDVADWWSNVLKLNAVSDQPTPLATENHVASDDFDVTIEFTSKNPLVKAPEPKKVTVLLSSGWVVGNSTGFAASRLIDDHYTVITKTDKAATDTTPAVTHREAVREDRDSVSTEATYFVHLRHLDDRQQWFPHEITFGVGLATGVKGRLYFGLSYPLGSAGALTFGATAGTVKRLSHNINPNNVGDADPEATRRDVVRGAPFVSLSFRFD